MYCGFENEVEIIMWGGSTKALLKCILKEITQKVLIINVWASKHKKRHKNYIFLLNVKIVVNMQSPLKITQITSTVHVNKKLMLYHTSLLFNDCHTQITLCILLHCMCMLWLLPKNKAIHKTLFFSSFFRIIKRACNIDDGGKINFPFKRTALRDMHADNWSTLTPFSLSWLSAWLRVY